MNHCEICLIEKEDGDKYFYKWSDAGPDGSDIDGFCCRDCAILEPYKQAERRYLACRGALNIALGTKS